MKQTILLLATILLVVSCDEEKFDSSVPCNVGVDATIRDLNGLDGCGFVFVLDDGTKLEPLRLLICGTPPLPKEVTEDPLYQFEWIDGKRVKIGYEETKALSSCMAGKVVKITCIQDLNEEPQLQD